MKTFSWHIKVVPFSLLMLSGSTMPKVMGDAYSDDKKGNAYGLGLQSAADAVC